MKLKDKVALVTGAAKGMGSAISLTLAREGADLMLSARELEPLEEVAAQVRAMGRRAEVISTDVVDAAQVAAMVERTKEAFGGRIDILVNVIQMGGARAHSDSGARCGRTRDQRQRRLSRHRAHTAHGHAMPGKGARPRLDF